MEWLRRFYRRLVPRSLSDDAMDREISYHIAELAQSYIAHGLTPDEAQRRAILEFGGREQVKQTIREVHVSALAESITFNAQAAGRFLRKSPFFSFAVTLTLALAIGANSAVFSAIDGVVLRPLPYPDGDQLAVLYQHDAIGRDANHFVAPVRLEDWNRMNTTFQAISGYYLDDLSETSGTLPEGLQRRSLHRGFSRSWVSHRHLAVRLLRQRNIGVDPMPFSSVMDSGSAVSMEIHRAMSW